MTAGKSCFVGIGPGSTEHMTARARAAIAEADTIIGLRVTYIAGGRPDRGARSSASP